MGHSSLSKSSTPTPFCRVRYKSEARATQFQAAALNHVPAHHAESPGGGTASGRHSEKGPELSGEWEMPSTLNTPLVPGPRRARPWRGTPAHVDTHRHVDMCVVCSRARKTWAHTNMCVHVSSYITTHKCTHTFHVHTYTKRHVCIGAC